MDAKDVIVQGYPSGSNTPAVYLFAEPSTGWANATQTAEFSAPGLLNYDFFGSALSISGPNLLIGGGYTSAAYLYVKPAGGWQTTAQPNVTLLSTDSSQANFGDSVAIVGTTIVVGDTGAVLNQGAAYVYSLQ